MARTTRKKTGRKTTARRKTAKRTSTKAKRSAAAKKAARTRAANKAKRSRAAKKAAATRKRNSRRKTAKRTSSKRKSRSTTSKAKRSRAAKKAWATRRRNAAKRSRAAKRGASKRRSSKRKPATRRKARRTTTRRTSKAKRSRAAKKGWATRRRNSGRRGARRTSKRRTSKRRTSRRRSAKMFGMKMPKMKGLKGGLKTLMMGGLALGLVGGLVYFPLNLVSAQTGAMVNSISGVINQLPISANNAADVITLGTGVLTLAVGGMILNAAKRRKMFSSKTQGMLPTALVLGTSAYTISKLQTANIGASFNQLLTGKPVAAAKTLNQGTGSMFSSRFFPNNNNIANNVLNQGTTNNASQATMQGSRMLGMSSMYGSHKMAGHGMHHMGTSNALYQNNSANAGRIFGARLGSAKRKLNLF